MSERSKSLENILGSRAIPKKEDDTEDVGPCASRPANKFVNCLHVHDGPKPVYSFQYSGIGVRSTFEPGTFAVWFRDGVEEWKLTVQGRNLWPVYNYLQHHRLEWIRVADRDLHADDVPVVTAVQVEKVEEPED